MAVISVVVIGLTYMVCDFLRRQFQLRMSPSLAKDTILDFLISVELCIGSFELGVILDHYGLLAWSIGLVSAVIYQVFRWKDFDGPSPGLHLQKYFEGKKTATEVLMRWAILVVSGLMTYR